MSNVDYLHVGAPVADVMAAVRAATAMTELVDGDTLVNGDQRTALTVAPSVDDENATVVDVYYGGDLVDRRVILAPHLRLRGRERRLGHRIGL